MLLSPDDIHCNFNLGHSLKRKDAARYRQLIQKAYELDHTHGPSMIEYADILEKEDQLAQAQEWRQKALDNYMERWKANELFNFEYSWFASLADTLNQPQLAI